MVISYKNSVNAMQNGISDGTCACEFIYRDENHNKGYPFLVKSIVTNIFLCYMFDCVQILLKIAWTLFNLCHSDLLCIIEVKNGILTWLIDVYKTTDKHHRGTLGYPVSMLPVILHSQKMENNCVYFHFKTKCNRLKLCTFIKLPSKLYFKRRTREDC